MAKRRSNGEGNIRKRKDGRWEGRYTAGFDPATGKQVFKNVLGKTQNEVKEKLKKALEESQKLDFTRTGKYTVSQWMEEWFENVCKIKVRPSSHQTYRGYIDHHISPYIGKIPIEKLSTMDLQKLCRKLMDKGRVERIESKKQPKGLGPKTVRNVMQVISSAMDFAVAQKIITENPCKAVELPKVEKQEMQTIPAEQLQAFLAEAKASGVYEMYYIELSTGLRRGELLGLKWQDIDWNNAVITVRRQVARVNGEITEAPLKTKNSYRRVSISPQAIEVLKTQKAKTNSEYVFPSPTGGPISPDSVNNMLKRVLARAGIPKVRFHDLRHTFATIALQNGVDIKTVSSILGHFSAGFTLDTYVSRKPTNVGFYEIDENGHHRDTEMEMLLDFCGVVLTSKTPAQPVKWKKATSDFDPAYLQYLVLDVQGRKEIAKTISRDPLTGKYSLHAMLPCPGKLVVLEAKNKNGNAEEYVLAGYLHGTYGLKKDHQKAEKLMREGAENGNPAMAFEYGAFLRCKNELEYAEKYLRQAAEIPGAKIELTELLKEKGSPEDIAEARSLVNSLWEQGYRVYGEASIDLFGEHH